LVASGSAFGVVEREDDCRVTNPEVFTAVQRDRLGNAPRVDERAVARAEVAERQHPVGAPFEGGVMAGDLLVVDDEIAVVASSDHEAAAVDLDRGAGLEAGGDREPQHDRAIKWDSRGQVKSRGRHYRVGQVG
jgi:hypothetical protein